MSFIVNVELRQQAAAVEDGKRLRTSQEQMYKQEPADLMFGSGSASDAASAAAKRPDLSQLFPAGVAPPTNPGFPFDFANLPSLQDQLRYADTLSR